MFNIAAFVTYILITAFTPGPNTIMSMACASRYGFKKALRFDLGMLLGFSVVMILCTVFSATIFTFIPMFKPVMLVLGAAYMLFLAWKLYKSPPGLESRESNDTGFWSGTLLQFINPKIIIYGITSMSSYILPHFSSPPVLFGFAILLALVGFAGTICWAVFGAAFSRVLSRHSKVVNTVMALLLVYCAISLFL